MIAAAGVRLAVSRVSRRGACRRSARSRSIRPVEYMPELQEDSAAVSTTKLMMPAAAGMPTLPNAATNGLTPGSNSDHGTSDRMISRAPT